MSHDWVLVKPSCDERYCRCRACGADTGGYYSQGHHPMPMLATNPFAQRDPGLVTPITEMDAHFAAERILSHRGNLFPDEMLALGYAREGQPTTGRGNVYLDQEDAPMYLPMRGALVFTEAGVSALNTAYGHGLVGKSVY